ncbi:MAG: ABC transporter ATP-binding protein [Mycoplasmatales bacterium]
MIKIKNLSKKYGIKEIFKNLNLEIDQGDFIWIYGVSGAGKTTLLNILGMLDEDYTGSIEILGLKNPKIDGSGKALLKNDISYLFQNYGLVEYESIYYNLNVINKVAKKKDKKEIMQQVLQKVGLKHLKLKQAVYELSGGEQQRLAIAKILLKQPKIIFCDESTGSLDMQNAKVIMNLLKELNNQGATIVIVSHDDLVANYVNKKLEIF